VATRLAGIDKATHQHWGVLGAEEVSQVTKKQLTGFDAFHMTPHL